MARAHESPSQKQLGNDPYLDQELYSSRILKFQPGRIGLKCNATTGKVEKVDAGGQAESSGVQPGWHIMEINGEQYSAQLLRIAASGMSLYDIHFHATTRKQGNGSFGNDPHWAHVRSMSKDDEKLLEERWDGRHSMHFSRNNVLLNPSSRDYFDRPRDYDGDHPGVKDKVRWRPTWSLVCDESEMKRDEEGFVIPPQIGASSASSPGKRFESQSSGSQPSRRKPTWDDRHHVTLSAGNHLLHDNCKEYFSRVLQPRSKRVLQQRKNGITLHMHPHRQVGNPDGVDDHPSPAEILLSDHPSGGRQAVSLPRLQRGGQAASQPVLPSGRPDASFDSWGE